MQAIDDIFALWPDINSMAEALGEKPDTVSRWRLRKRIPDHAWSAIICAGQPRTLHLLSVELLYRLNAPMKRRGRLPKGVAA